MPYSIFYHCSTINEAIKMRCELQHEYIVLKHCTFGYCAINISLIIYHNAQLLYSIFQIFLPWSSSNRIFSIYLVVIRGMEYCDISILIYTIKFIYKYILIRYFRLINTYRYKSNGVYVFNL